MGMHAGKNAIARQEFITFLREFGSVVKKATELTKEQLEYWNSARTNLDTLDQGTEGFLESSYSKAQCKKLLESWKAVDESYTLCGNQVSNLKAIR